VLRLSEKTGCAPAAIASASSILHAKKKEKNDNLKIQSPPANRRFNAKKKERTFHNHLQTPKF